MNMLKVRGYGGAMLFAEVIKKLVGIVWVLVLINVNFRFVIIGWTCCALFDFIISEVFYIKKYGFSIWPSCKYLVTNVLISFVLALAVSLIVKFIFDNLYSRFFVGGVLFLLLYFCINYKRIRSLL